MRGLAATKEDYVVFRDMVKKGEPGKILKCICSSRERAEGRVENLVLHHNATILYDYDEGNEPYADVIEEGMCHCL